MNAIIAPDTRINAVSAATQQQPTTVSPHDIRQFQQALTTHIHADMTSGNFVKNGIASIEKQEDKLNAVMTRFSDSTTEAASTSSLLAFQSAHLQMYVTYQATARAISMTAQDITELMRMQ